MLTLVDTGTRMSEGRVLAALRRMGRRPEDVRQIAITHSHGDHAGSASRLRQISGAPVIAGAADAAVLEGREPYMFAPAAWGRAAYGWLASYPRFRPDRTVAERTELDGGLVAIPTPGHTPGHLSFFAPDDGVLFAGDAVWNLGAFTLDWRGFAQDRERSRESVRELAELPAEVIVVGHGPPVRRGGRDRLRALVR